MSDKYDEAIAYLTEHPEQIESAWATPSRHATDPVSRAHCLFQHVTPTGWPETLPDGRTCGCLTLIASPGIHDYAWTAELTKEIRRDKRIPGDIKRVTPELLPIFAEWQRRIDKELSR